MFHRKNSTSVSDSYGSWLFGDLPKPWQLGGGAAVLLAQMLEALAKDKTSGSWSRRRWNDRCYIVIRGQLP